MRTYAIALNWGMLKQDAQEKACRDLLASAIARCEQVPPAVSFDLAIATADNIYGYVVLVLVDTLQPGAPPSPGEEPSTAPYRWLYENIESPTKWLDSDNLHEIQGPLTRHFSNLRVMDAAHLPAASSQERQQHDVGDQAACTLFAFRSQRDRTTLLKEAIAAMLRATALLRRDRSTIGTFEDFVWSSRDLYTLPLHAARSELLFGSDDDRMEALIRPSDKGEFATCWLLLVRAEPAAVSNAVTKEMKGLPDLLCAWRCPPYYAEPEYFIFLGEELCLAMSAFIRLRDSAYVWTGKPRLEDEDMRALGLQPMQRS